MKRNFQNLKHPGKQLKSNVPNNNEFDVLVIGGGIYGSWVAYDATLRGLKVAIVDKGDWGSGTSSASSKLLHGGLRYLENLELGLVKKSLQERQKLWQMSSHRVKPLRFVIPNYKNHHVAPWKLKVGLWLYDCLAGSASKKISGDVFKKRKFYDALEFKQQFPFLSEEGLSRSTSGMEYSDGYHDDARAVLELIAGVVEKGGVAVNYAKATELLWEHPDECVRVTGAVVQDQVSQEKISVRAKVTVHTAGPWVEELLYKLSQEVHHNWEEKPGSPPLPKVCYEEKKPLQKMTKGVHLVMPPLPTDKAFLMFAPRDGRVFFMIPWYGKTLLGTTDTFYEGSPDEVSIGEDDVEYLLEAANRHLNLEKVWTKQDICGQFVGLRSLVHPKSATGKNAPSSVSRDWHVEKPYAGFYVSVGGKYTSARADSAKLMQQCLEQFSDKVSASKKSPTENQGGAWSVGEHTNSLKQECFEMGLKQGWDKEELELLFFRHGSQTKNILQKTSSQKTHLIKRIHPDVPFTLAEWEYVLEHEMVVRFEDLFRRRFPLALLRKWSREEVEALKKSAGLER